MRQTASRMEAYGNEEGCGIATTWKKRSRIEEHSLAQDGGECGKEKLCRRSGSKGHSC